MTVSTVADRDLLDRVATDDYPAWLAHVQPAAACAHPIQLRGTVGIADPTYVNPATGEADTTWRATEDMPDGVIYKACSNRRSTVCPACAEIYRADAYQLVLAGLAGGKTVPETVRAHSAVFATLTAPGFGLVHTRRTNKHGTALPCRPRRRPDTCPHGTVLSCHHTHGENDDRRGQPLCPACYDYDHHAVWNANAGELWRRTTIAANRLLRRHARQHHNGERVRLSFGKVCEYQRRGTVHFHVIARLDGIDPNDPDRVIPPPAWATVFVLTAVLREAIETTRFRTPPHPDAPNGWLIAWGDLDHGIDIRPVAHRGSDEITTDDVLSETGTTHRRTLGTTAVAGYLAKYATKATEPAGHASARITDETISLFADDTHVGRLIDACWQLGRTPDYAGLTRWAHMLGYGGHFFTKSRRYSTTFKALRKVRVDYRRRRHDVDDQDDDTAKVVLTSLTYAGIGWRTTADALLANTSAALARERRRTAREEIEHLMATAR